MSHFLDSANIGERCIIVVHHTVFIVSSEIYPSYVVEHHKRHPTEIISMARLLIPYNPVGSLYLIVLVLSHSFISICMLNSSHCLWSTFESGGDFSFIII